MPQDCLNIIHYFFKCNARQTTVTDTNLYVITKRKDKLLTRHGRQSFFFSHIWRTLGLGLRYGQSGTLVT